MAASYDNGPYLMGRTLQGTTFSTYVRSYMISKTNTTAKRVKPKTNLHLSLTTYLASRNRTTRSLDVVTWADGTWSANAVTTSLGSSVIPNDVAESGRIEALMKLLERLKSETWNVSTFAGEMPEAVRYFKKTLTDVVALYRAVKRGDMSQVRLIRKRQMARPLARTKRTQALFDENGVVIKTSRYRKGRKALPVNDALQRTFTELNAAGKTLSGRWLEWRYAISPMLMDLNSALKAYHENVGINTIKRVTGRSSVSYSHSAPQGPNALVRSGSLMTTYGAYVTVSKDLAAYKQLGLLNPLATLYELTPLSFVLDWFIPVGRYIGALDAMVGVSVSSTWRTTVQDYVITRPAYTVSTLYQHPTAKTWSGNVSRYGVHTSVGKTYNRTANVVLSIPALLPQLSLSSKRFLDGLALLTTSLKRGK